MAGELHHQIHGINPFLKLPQVNTATVLLVGCQGIGKHKLAKSMVNVRVPYSVHIRTAVSLPLPEENEKDRPKIDLVVFMIDLTNKKSLSNVESSLPHIDVEYFLGKTCFVVSNVHNLNERTLDIETVTQLSDVYDSPLLCENLQREEGRTHLAHKLLKYLELSASLNPLLTPLVVNTTQRPYSSQTDMKSVVWTPQLNQQQSSVNGSEVETIG